MNASEIELIQEARVALRSGDAVAFREARALTIPELAVQIDVAASTLWRWEQGLSTPKGARAVRYAKALRRLRRQIHEETRISA